MSQVFTRGLAVAHGLTSRPSAVVSVGVYTICSLSTSLLNESVAVGRSLFRGTVQLRTYSTAQPLKQQPPNQQWREPSRQKSNNPITQAILELPSTPKMVEHLNRVFAPLTFPPELAARILIHPSHKHARFTSSARLGFLGVFCFPVTCSFLIGYRFRLGRRVMNAYLLLFLQSSSAMTPEHDLDHILERTLNTYVLGEYVGPQWQLARVMSWTPAVSSPLESSTASSRSVGLYKVEGATVEAVVGGIFHQYVSRCVEACLRSVEIMLT